MATNREILFILKMQNQSRAAIGQFTDDMRKLNAEMAKTAKTAATRSTAPSGNANRGSNGSGGGAGAGRPTGGAGANSAQTGAATTGLKELSSQAAATARSITKIAAPSSAAASALREVSTRARAAATALATVRSTGNRNSRPSTVNTGPAASNLKELSAQAAAAARALNKVASPSAGAVSALRDVAARARTAATALAAIRSTGRGSNNNAASNAAMAALNALATAANVATTALRTMASRAGAGGGGGGGGGPGGGRPVPNPDAGDGGGMPSWVKNLAGVIGAGIGLKYVIDLADGYKQMSGQIALVTKNSAEQKAVQEQIYLLAQRSRTDLNATTDVYTRLARSAKNLGLSQNEVLKITEGIGQAMQISGASGEAANAAIIQFGQGLQSGTLRGEELNSVLEQAPRLAQAIEKGMGLASGSLRKVAAEGKLVPKAIIEGLQKELPTIQKEFDKLPLTVGQGITRMKNSFQQLVGSFDAASGATDGIGKFLSKLADIIGSPAFRSGLADLANMVGSVLTASLEQAGRAIAFMQEHATAIQVVLYAAAGAFIAFRATIVVGAILDWIAAIRAAGVAMTVFNAIMAINPFVLIATAIGAVVALLVVFRNSINYSADGLATIGDAAAVVWEDITAGISALTTYLSDAFATAINFVSGGVAGMNGGFEDFAKNAAIWIDTVISVFIGMGMVIRKIINDISDAITSVLDPIKSAITNLAMGLYGVFSAAAKGVMSLTSQVIDAINQSDVASAEAAKRAAARNGTVAKGGPGGGIALPKGITDYGKTLVAEFKKGAFTGAEDYVASLGPRARARGKKRREEEAAANNPGAGVNLDEKGVPVKSAEDGKKDKGAKARESALKEIKAYLEELKSANAEQVRINAAILQGPDASRLLEVTLAGEKAVRDKLAQAKKAGLTLDKDLINNIRTQAEESEKLKQVGAYNQMVMELKKANLETDHATDVQRKNNSMIFAGVAARRAFAQQLQIEEDVRTRLKAFTDAKQLITPEMRADALKAATSAAEASSQMADFNAVKGLIDSTKTSTEKAVDAFEEAKIAFDAWMNVDASAGGGRGGPADQIERAQRAIDKLRPPADFVDALKQGLGDFVDGLKTPMEQMQEVGTKAISGIADAFTSLALTGKASFGGLARSVISDLLGMITRAIMFKTIMAGLNMISPGLGNFLAPAVEKTKLFHNGGIAGKASSYGHRNIDPAIFAGARRMHTGGIPGLKSGEVPIIAKDTEVIMPTVRLPDGTMGVKSAGGGGGGGGVSLGGLTVNLKDDSGSNGGMSPDQQEMMGRMLEEEINVHLQRKLEEWRRPGGPLHNRK